jgi:hypothetical protein
MTQTMFARAAAPKSSFSLAVVIGTLTVLVTFFVASIATPPPSQREELRSSAPAMLSWKA